MTGSLLRFLGLSFDQPAPDHFSRLRGWLPKNAMAKIDPEVPLQFIAKGLTINEGIAIDARLVSSLHHAGKVGCGDRRKIAHRLL